MSEELWSSLQVIAHLEVNLNNLRQMQHRGAIRWVKKVGKEVFYLADDVRAYRKKRDDRNSQ
jgi:hypothetical protein